MYFRAWPELLSLTFEGTLEVFQGEGLPGERETNLKFGASPGRIAWALKNLVEQWRHWLECKITSRRFQIIESRIAKPEPPKGGELVPFVKCRSAERKNLIVSSRWRNSNNTQNYVCRNYDRKIWLFTGLGELNFFSYNNLNNNKYRWPQLKFQNAEFNFISFKIWKRIFDWNISRHRRKPDSKRMIPFRGPSIMTGIFKKYRWLQSKLQTAEFNFISFKICKRIFDWNISRQRRKSDSKKIIPFRGPSIITGVCNKYRWPQLKFQNAESNFIGCNIWKRIFDWNISRYRRKSGSK